MPSIGAVQCILWSKLLSWIRQQSEPQQTRMSEIYKTLDSINACWFWQRRKKQLLKEKLFQLMKKYPDEYRKLYNKWKGV